MTPLLSDENNYLYLGKLVSEGQIPYKDFFYAHPPLQLYIFALIFKVFGYNFIILKSVALVSTILTAILIFQMGENSRLLASVIYLCSASVFFTGATNLGINLTAFLCVLGYYFFEKNKLISGVIFGIASLAGIYAFFIYLGLLFTTWRKPMDFIGGAATSVIVHVAFIRITGLEYFYQSFMYHLTKPITSSSNRLTFIIKTISVDWIMILMFIVVFVILILKREFFKEKLTYPICIYLIFIISLSNPLTYYLILVYPFICLLIAKKIPNKFSVILGITFFVLLACYSNVKMIPEFKEQFAFGNMDKVVNFLKDKEGPYFGDYTVASLLALELNQDMTVSSEIDTYPWAIRILGVKRMADSIKEQSFSYLIIHKLAGTVNPIWKLKPIYSIIKERCSYPDDPIKEINYLANDYVVYECKE
jgi:hypothetical protein